MLVRLKHPIAILIVFLLVNVSISLFALLPAEEATTILFELRIPRVLIAMAVGGLLSISGLMLQSIFNNPLVEPYTMGVASGAALGAGVLSSLFSGMVSLGVGSFLGAFGVLLVFISMFGFEKRASEKILIAGIMINIFCSSMLAVWMVLAKQQQVQSLNFWMLGDLSRGGYSESILLFVALFFGTAWIFRRLKFFDAFLFGPNLVDTFGISKNRFQKQVVLVNSVLVALVVSVCGVIGFLGLIAPHWARSWVGSRMRKKLSVTLLLGANILVFSDWVARLLASPHELPVGAITALIGAPVLILILKRSNTSSWQRSGGVE